MKQKLMKRQPNFKTSRRQCLQSALAILPAGLARGYAANDKLDIGIIGVGGIGGLNARKLTEFGQNVTALCDVDETLLAKRAQDYPKAKRFTDFRKMLDKRKLDGVVVATPDHTHAHISMWAMRNGVNVYCQKPLTRTVEEARLLRQAAAEEKVITQMGTSSTAAESVMRTVELVRSGALGEITEVHCWSDRAMWPQGYRRPAGSETPPKTLDWDLWLGGAPERPFVAKWPEGHDVFNVPDYVKTAPYGWWRKPWSNVYHPFTWRGWRDFGTGALGDIAPHSLNVVFWALDLGAPSSVEVIETSGLTPDMYPQWSVIRFDYPVRGSHPPFTIYWYDGGKKPPPEICGEKDPRAGLVWIGTKGSLPAGRGPFHGRPEEEYEQPPQQNWGREEVHLDWVKGIKSQSQPGCAFDYAGPFTEAYLLGNVALQVGHRIEWNPLAFRVTNCREANQYLTREYRKGWELTQFGRVSAVS